MRKQIGVTAFGSAVVTAVVVIATIWFSDAQAAGTASAGQAKAATCAGCHGPNGVSSNPLWPNIAGQQEQYLVKSMKAYRDGQRSDPVMVPMAAGLSDQDIEDLAAYFASLPAGG